MQKFYLALILLLPAIGIGCYAAAVHHVDPYGFYKPLDRGSFPIKPAMIKNQNMVKAQIVRKIKPDTVIIGSSRVDYGIDPTHAYFDGKSVYNMGLKGIRIPELKHMVKHAYHSGAREILWGLDFLSFNAYMEQRSDFSTGRLYNGENIPDTDMHTLISISSLKPVLQTLSKQSEPDTPHTRLNGQHTPHALNQKTRDKGARSLFNNSAFVFLSKLYYPTPHRLYAFTDDDGEDTWRDFEDTLSFMREHNMNVTFFIAPQHAYQYALMYQSGLFDTYKSWKVQLNTSLQKHGFTVKDYTVINAITTEPIPNEKNIHLTYYWESSHYRPVIGNMIMDDLMGKPSNLHTTTNTAEFERDLIRYQCDNRHETNDIRRKIINAGLENRLIPKLNCR
ncbi:MAG: hypothetical protein COB76_01900 [Alphaproteobacteria bacterium]|nr:MAG: hypothetical protein COB76_01900 [Alphaproteobacteria bacterium]